MPKNSSLLKMSWCIIFFKFYMHKVVLIIQHTGWNKNLMEKNVKENNNHKLYNKPLINFKL